MKRMMIKDTLQEVGKEITIQGWVHTYRKMSKVAFIDLRDTSGIVQVVLEKDKLDQETFAKLSEVKPEYVVSITGNVIARDEKFINKKLETGTVEVHANAISILNTSETPPFEIDNETPVSEEIRMQYRYLDLRRSRMAENIKTRSRITSFIRQYLDEQGFLEIETPILTKSTPEGARDFLVPSRNHPGSFYALPQSPQQFKQLLMASGIERYFQIARCFRDEDTRGDRQPEFTQMDLEMAFVSREDVMALNEALLIDLVTKLFPEKKIQETPFPRFTYKEVMEKYGTDRPDLREDKDDPNLLAFCWVIDFPFFEKTDDGGWTFTHNPFSRPKDGDVEHLRSKEHIESILTTQYDVALNGFEIGGGSIRNHEPELLTAVFEIMGFQEEQIKEEFGHMLTAFSYGTPPHGGIAWGLDRLVAIIQNEPNIREVIAFPKTGDGRDLLMEAPAQVKAEQLADLSIRVVTEE